MAVSETVISCQLLNNKIALHCFMLYTFGTAICLVKKHVPYPVLKVAFDCG